MLHYPVFLELHGREALVVGAGPEIPAKVERLLAAGAAVTVLCEGEPDARIVELAREGRLTLDRRAVTDADLAGRAIVFLAPGDEALSQRLHGAAAREGRLFGTVDRPETSTFISPALVQAGGLTIAFSTGGASPGLLRRIREDLGVLFGDEKFGRFLEALRALRAGLPRGERAPRLAEAVKDFRIEATLRFPAWFERGEDP